MLMLHIEKERLKKTMAPIDHMNGGNGKNSYANNSLFQEKVISTTWPITEEAITKMFSTTIPETLCIAELGCCSGPNSFIVLSRIIETIQKLCVKFGRKKLPEFQVYFNDLPENDFNSIFKLLPEFQKSLKKQYGPMFGHCFFSGIPCSFYERLFQSNSVDFVHSSYSVHWLSKVPEMVETNKGNIYVSPTSPASVVKAYSDQFEKDFTMFLENRAKEIVPEGHMVLTFVGRTGQNIDLCKGAYYIWELLATILNQMAKEGLIEEEKLDSFNMPFYTASPEEVKYLIEKEGSFNIDRLEATEVKWAHDDSKNQHVERFKNGGKYMANVMRAISEPLLVSQFGNAIMDDVFTRFSEILDDFMAKEKTTHNINISISLTKKMSLI